MVCGNKVLVEILSVVINGEICVVRVNNVGALVVVETNLDTVDSAVVVGEVKVLVGSFVDVLASLVIDRNVVVVGVAVIVVTGVIVGFTKVVDTTVLIVPAMFVAVGSKFVVVVKTTVVVLAVVGVLSRVTTVEVMLVGEADFVVFSIVDVLLTVVGANVVSVDETVPRAVIPSVNVVFTFLVVVGAAVGVVGGIVIVVKLPGIFVSSGIDAVTSKVEEDVG